MIFGRSLIRIFYKIFFHKYIKRMATHAMTEEVHLVNIITIAEDRLQSNFRTLANRINKHGEQIAAQKSDTKQVEKKLQKQITDLESKSRTQVQHLNTKIDKCLEMIIKISGQSQSFQKLLSSCQENVQSNKKSFVNYANLIEQKTAYNRTQILELTEKLERAQSDIYKAFEEILKKEDSTEVLKITRQVEGTKQKIEKYEKQCKVLQHKLEKFEIQNQKTERNQSKKETELMKEIEDRIKKQLKNIQKNMPGNNQNFRQTGSGVFINPLNFENSPQISENATPPHGYSPQKALTSRKEPLGNQDSNRLSFQLEQEDTVSVSLKNSLEKYALSKMNEKLEGFENKIKNLQSSISNLTVANRKTQKSDSSQQIKEKINQIKPELIKLWAKCDALDDRMSFTERKLEDKSKILNTLMETQRENGVGRLQDKIKALQTQLYASLKQLKTKVQGKVSSQDYEKHSFALQQKLKQMTQIIYQKSDKLEVKKALLFLQSKIKQIILVISEDQQNEKDALLTKKQLKCISCDKDIDKISKFSLQNGRGNWDAMPLKQHSPEVLGKFGMTGFGSLSKKLKKLESKDLPLLKSKKHGSTNLRPINSSLDQTNKIND